jgi:prolyl-tRNA synthetase
MDVLNAADMIEQCSVRGCMILKPLSMDIWEAIRASLDRQIRATGAKNYYFPLLIPASLLSQEASHIEGFAKECAVVTHHRLKANPQYDPKTDRPAEALTIDEEAKLDEPLVIRPTSEAAMWTSFRKWIHSHRDLPLKVNQWANVVRWELRPRPFLRTSEFLWQEGHTAHASRDDALRTTTQMIDLYAKLCRVRLLLVAPPPHPSQDLLALPVIKGIKSKQETFAGADLTFTIEGLMQNGWALQCGTSHFLGTNFGTAFDVSFQDENGATQPVWATSWGVSTRLIGALIMSHSDDVCPLVAPLPHARP